MDIDEESTQSNVNNNEGGAKPVKLPYFHRTLSQEETALIGDIRPKPISSAEAQPIKVETKKTESSAWNAANTWEERDCTSWGKKKVTDVFLNNLNSKKVNVTKIEKVEGNSSITHVRGRARYMYEWSFSLDVEVKGVMGTFKGTSVVSDVINDQLDDLEIEMKWTGTRPTVIDGKSLQKTLKEEIIERMKVYEEEFRNYNK
jgi:hypothetical protein